MTLLSRTHLVTLMVFGVFLMTVVPATVIAQQLSFPSSVTPTEPSAAPPSVPLSYPSGVPSSDSPPAPSGQGLSFGESVTTDADTTNPARYPQSVDAADSPGGGATTLGVGATIVQWLWWMIAGFFGMLTSLGGQLLDFALLHFVLNFGDNYANSGIGNRVDVLWSTVRDIFNISFIFGLVYIGFSMILDISKYDTRKWLINLIIAALLVNFSLFITKFVIDISNQLASEIYAAFPDPTDTGKIEVSNSLMNAMGVTTIFNSESNGTIPGLGPDGGVTGASFGYMFGAMMIFLISAFVFAAGGFLLMIRYIMLHIYMLMSPFLFLGFVFPQFMSMTRGHWSDFFKRAFVAPVYMLMLYFALHVLTGTKDAINAQVNTDGGGGTSLAAVFGRPGDEAISAFASTIPPFLLGCGFLLAAVILANKLGANGSSLVMSVGNNAKRWGMQKVRGAAIAPVRGVGGVGARWVGERAENERRRLDRSNAAMAQRGGAYRAMARLSDRTFGAALGSAAGASIAGSETVAQRRKRVQEQNNKFNQTGNTIDRSNKLSTATTDYRLAAGANNGVKRQSAVNTAGAAVRKMTDDEVKGLSFDELTSSAVAANLTDGHMKALGESGLYTNEKLKKIGDVRNKSVIAEAVTILEDPNVSDDDRKNSFALFGQTITNMSGDRKQGLGVDIKDPKPHNLNHERIAFHLTDKDIENIEQSGKYDATQIKAIKDARDQARVHVAEGDVDMFLPASFDAAKKEVIIKAAQKSLVSGSTRDAGKLPEEVFTQANMMPYITGAILEQRLKNQVDNIGRIETAVKSYFGSIGDADKKARIEKQWKKWQEKSPELSQLDLGI